MEINYVRCKECGYVYNDSLSECPNCGAENNSITEDLSEAVVFNILD